MGGRLPRHLARRLGAGARRAAGWRIRERVFTTPTRSVMHLCANTTLTRATEQDGSSVP